MMTSNDIRQAFIDFFVEEQGHTFVPSSPLLPAQDPTLLFANAGMNQFKSIFLGTETRDYVRAANTQKCIRAGGKHNDLEDVGHDCYHHTFFEMLGNWSFGDYFKAESIEWAWQLLTEVWGLPKDRLYATVFGGDAADGLDADSQAEALWREKTDIDPSHILHGDKKDNFWEMGETGPCGPCSELHIDLTEDGSGKTLVNADDARVIEIWNLVFIQYNRDETGKLTPLPAQHVDTGMGFERVCAVMQGKKSNYATDVFVPLIQKIEALSGHVYGGTSGLDDRYDVTSQDDPGDVACRVVADHARTLTFAITDGIMPGNEGRNYVVRRILRRAARYGRQNLGIDGPFLCDLVVHIVEQMGPIFPELVSRREFVESVVREEEESFGRTLDRGIDLFNKQADKLETAGGKTLPGETVF
jgi:alanyl-tRNA synthetase